MHVQHSATLQYVLYQRELSQGGRGVRQVTALNQHRVSLQAPSFNARRAQAGNKYADLQVGRIFAWRSFVPAQNPFGPRTV